MRPNFLRGSAGCTFALVLSALPLQAQTVTGAITGSVTDASGAVIPNATVNVINTATGVSTPSTTNGVGVYTIRFLPIGRYKVVVSATGFSTQTTSEFTLEIDQTVNLKNVLTIGNQTTVEVLGSAPILNTTDGSLGIVMSANEIQNIPLEGRNFSSVTMFQPGAVNTNPGGMTNSNAIERDTFNDDVPSINGNRAQANNYLLDGIDMNEGQNNLIGYNPAPDAIGEIKVISANAPATYGNVNGGAVVALLKSGTNDFHGSAYGYLQNWRLDANSWSNKHNTTPTPITHFTQSIFGGTVGGPIIRNKLFFFGDYEGARNPSGGFQRASVFTAAQRTGDFSAVGQQLYDSQNNFAPYDHNQLPIINPVAKFLFANPAYYPLPNTAPLAGTLTQNNLQGPTKNFRVNNQFDIKIESDPSAQDKITGFYAQSRAYDGSTAVLAITFPSFNIFPTKLGGGTWVHTFSPSIVNEFRAGFTRIRWGQGVPIDPTGHFGLNGNSIVGIPFGVQEFEGFSYQNIENANGSMSGVGTNAGPQVYVDNTFTYGDDFTIQRGKHLMSMGATALRYQQEYTQNQNAGALGSFSYTGAFTASPLAGASLYGPADFVVDYVSQSQVEAGGEFGNRQWRVAGYFQDDWKILPNLTFNLGIRYEFDQPWYEVHNKTGNILPLNGGTVEYAGSVPAGAPSGSIVCPERACYKANYKQIMPRFGFAYQASPKFVVRGGYGATSFFEGNDVNQRLTYIYPYVASLQSNYHPPTGTGAGAQGQPYTIEDGFTGSGSFLQYGQWPQHIQPAYIQEFNLTTEYAITPKTSLTVGYVGETGQHVEDYGNANQLTLAEAAAGAHGPYDSLTGGGGVLITESRAMSNYNAMQATLRQRESYGLEYTVNYTYARAMTNAAGNFGVANVQQTLSFQDYYNSGADYGPSGQDVRHNVSAVAVYALPVGIGKKYGSGMNRALDEAVGGWSLSGTFIGFTGVPVTIFDNGTSNTNSYGSARPNQYRHLKVEHRNINNWFGTDASAIPCLTVDANNNAIDNGTCAYGQTASYAFGTASNGTERAPGYYQVDTSIFKSFHIIGEHSLTFRADAFNVLNVADYGNPNSSIGSYNPDPTQDTFGQITSVRHQERRLQLALNYKF